MQLFLFFSFWTKRRKITYQLKHSRPGARTVDQGETKHNIRPLGYCQGLFDAIITITSYRIIITSGIGNHELMYHTSDCYSLNSSSSVFPID